MTQRTITLTGRPPVRIAEENWPLLASTSDEWFEGQVKEQSSRYSQWFVAARRHEDGRALIYATYKYTSYYQGERCIVVKHGVLIPPASNQDVCDAINRVCKAMSAEEHRTPDAERWHILAAQCIADMPVEVL